MKTVNTHEAKTVSHGAELGRMPRHHNDPFDWMLIAQAQVERVALLTDDRLMRLYGVEVIW